MLYKSVERLHDSHIFKHGAPFYFHKFKMSRSKACYLFKLCRKMRNAAIMHLISNFSKVQFIINQQFFYPLNFVSNHKMFNSSTLNFGKKIGEISIIML